MEDRKQKMSEIFNIILLILLILFSIFVIYQIIRKIFVGSWTTESILISLALIIISSLLMIAGFLISLTKTSARTESNLNNLKTSFCNLAKDFKEHLSKHRT